MSPVRIPLRRASLAFLTGVAFLALSVAAGGEGMAASNEPVDAAALAALRPGMPMSASR